MKRKKKPVFRQVTRDRDGLIRCRMCRCTEGQPCNPPCSWTEPDLCSGCAEILRQVTEWAIGAYRPSFAALKREVVELKPQYEAG